MRSKELVKKNDLTGANPSVLKAGKVIRIATLDAICAELRCRPGSPIEYVAE